MLNTVSRDFLQGFYRSGAPKAWLLGRVHFFGGRTAAAESHWRSALKTIDRAREKDPDEVSLVFWRAHVHACLGEKTEARKMLELALQLSPAAERENSTNVAVILVLLGEHDKAMTLLESKLKTTVGPVLRVELRFAPAFDALRDNPRFQAMLVEPTKSAAP